MGQKRKEANIMREKLQEQWDKEQAQKQKQKYERKKYQS